jgi:hypothetical protein
MPALATLERFRLPWPCGQGHLSTPLWPEGIGFHHRLHGPSGADTVRNKRYGNRRFLDRFQSEVVNDAILRGHLGCPGQRRGRRIRGFGRQRVSGLRSEVVVASPAASAWRSPIWPRDRSERRQACPPFAPMNCLVAYPPLKLIRDLSVGGNQSRVPIESLFCRAGSIRNRDRRKLVCFAQSCLSLGMDGT